LNTLFAITEDHILTERLELSADASSGQADVAFKNVTTVLVNDYIILGTMGSETAEILQIDSISGLTVTFKSNLLYNHKEYDIAVKTLFNKRKFWRKNTGESVYTQLIDEGSPKTIEVDNPNGTMLEDSNGVTTSVYKATYFNSTTNVNTAVDDAIAQYAGDSRNYASLFKIKREAGMAKNPYIDDDLVYNYRLEAEGLINGMLAGIYSVPFTSNIPKIITYIATLLSAGYLLQTEYGVEDDIDINKTGTSKIARAEKLLNKILNGDLQLLDSNNELIGKSSNAQASYSNDYDDDKDDKGELFNLENEQFKAANPDNPLSSTRR